MIESVRSIRKSILHMVHYSGSSHVGTCLSSVEILYTLYSRIMNADPGNPNDPDRDKFILSKGHGGAALYATLAEYGYFPKSHLNRYYIDGGLLPGHLDRTAVPGVEVSAGSLGHGLSLGLGMAMANKIDGRPGHVYVLLGDGELNEGSVWEAVMLASTLALDQLTAIVDYNKIQSFGRTNEVINQSNMKARWEAFGWEAYEADGHNPDELERILRLPQAGPKAVIAHTVKGKGVSFMEDQLKWHYKSPSDEEYEAALRELDETP